MKIFSTLWKKIRWALSEMWAGILGRIKVGKYSEEEYVEADVIHVGTAVAGMGRWSYKIHIVGVSVDGQYDEPGIEFNAWKAIQTGDRIRMWLRRHKGSDRIGPSWVTHWQPHDTNRWIRCG
jgi:hypothetical protein